MLGMSQIDISNLLNISQSAYSRMEKGIRSNLTIDHMHTIVEKYSVNPLFLLSGDLPYFIEANNLSGSRLNEPSIPYGSRSTTILVPLKAHASYVNEYTQEPSDLPRVIIPGLVASGGRVFEISGNSMEPILLHGDYVGCQRVENPHTIRDGTIYVVVSRTQGITVKYLRVTLHALRCLSANATEHLPFDLDLDEVREIWEVQIRITRHLHSGLLELPNNRKE